MLKTFFDKYKWIAIAVAFLVYSASLWHISGKVSEAEYNKEKFLDTQRIVSAQNNNARILGEVTRGYQELLATIRAGQAKNQKAINEALKDKRYTDCVVSDSVRDLYRKRLDKAERGPASPVPGPD